MAETRRSENQPVTWVRKISYRRRERNPKIRKRIGRFVVRHLYFVEQFRIGKQLSPDVFAKDWFGISARMYRQIITGNRRPPVWFIRLIRLAILCETFDKDPEPIIMRVEYVNEPPEEKAKRLEAEKDVPPDVGPPLPKPKRKRSKKTGKA